MALAAAMAIAQVAPGAQASDEPMDIAALTTRAEGGSAADQSRLGWIFFEGKTLPRDTQLAFHWFLKAAEQGDAEGLRGLQSVNLTGEEMTDGEKLGLDLIISRSKQSPPRPNSGAGDASVNERDAVGDAASTVVRYTKAAAEGDAAAQTALGVMYCQGKGVARDYVKAMSLLRQAAEKGNPDAQCQLARMYADGLGTAIDASAAVRWYTLAAAQQNAEAEYRLGLHSQCGCGTIKDDRKAFSWMESSAKRGNAEAQVSLAGLYIDGVGVGVDKVEGLKWLTRAAKQGNRKGQVGAAALNFSGLGVPTNVSEGIKWFTIAAAAGDPIAQFCLGRMYREGDGVPVDLTKAAAYYRRAAVQSDANAQYELARMLLAGEGVQPDALQSYAWFSIASDGGSTPAKEYVAVLTTKLARKDLDAANQLIPTLKASVKAPPAETPYINKAR